MLRVGFEPTIPPFERATTFHGLDRAATVIGPFSYAEQTPFIIYMGHPGTHLQGRRVTYEGPCVETNVAFASVMGFLSVYFVAHSVLSSAAEYLSNSHRRICHTCS
jgi:hypothetical protein